MTLCHCGLPLHYLSPMSRAVVDDIVRRLGAEIPVKVGLRTWMIPRHYIALHGLEAPELPFLGFKEVV